MADFVDALKQRNLKKIRAFPKSDLHNHFVLGGCRQYLRKTTGLKIEPVKNPISSMDEMHAWNRENLGERFETSEMRKVLIKAAFWQAQYDGVAVLEIGEDVWGLSEYFHNDIDELIEAFTTAHQDPVLPQPFSHLQRFPTRQRALLDTVLPFLLCDK